MAPLSDYCGYCGNEFIRHESDPPEICPPCLRDPETAAEYAEDAELAACEVANDEELERESFKEEL